MKREVAIPFWLSVCFISTTMALSLQFAVIEHMFMDLPWWGVQIGILVISLYSLLTLRQLYTHGRIWPKKALLFVFPLAFLHLLLNVPMPYAAGFCAFNLFFWWVAYRLSGRLAKLSPYGRPSGYL